MYFFEKKKKKHLYIYFDKREQVEFVLNYFIFKTRGLESHSRSKKIQNVIKVFKASKYGGFLYNRLLELNKNPDTTNLLLKNSFSFQDLSTLRNSMNSIVEENAINYLKIHFSFLITSVKNTNDVTLEVNMIFKKKSFDKKMIHFSEFEGLLNQELIENVKERLNHDKTSIIIYFTIKDHEGDESTLRYSH